MSEEAAIEFGFFRALRAQGLTEKVALDLYTEVVDTFVKSAAFTPALKAAKKIDPHAGMHNPYSGAVDVLGKPQFAHMAKTPAPRPAAPPMRTNPDSGMRDDLVGPGLASQVINRLKSTTQTVARDLGKNPMKANLTTTVPAVAGAAGAGAGGGLLGQTVLSNLTSR